MCMEVQKGEGDRRQKAGMRSCSHFHVKPPLQSTQYCKQIQEQIQEFKVFQFTFPPTPRILMTHLFAPIMLNCELPNLGSTLFFLLFFFLISLLVKLFLMHRGQNYCNKMQTSIAKGMYQCSSRLTVTQALDYVSVTEQRQNSCSSCPLVLLLWCCCFLQPWAVSLQLLVEPDSKEVTEAVLV